MAEKTVIMDAQAMDRALSRIAHEILEKYKGVGDVVLIGIQRRGVPLSLSIAEKIKAVEGVSVPCGVLDITWYRDDLSTLTEHPVIKGTDVPFSIEGKRVVLVDDVLYTGRTARAAMEALMDMGRALSIALAVLIDRGHRELPIRADYVGKNVPTAREERINVCVGQFDDNNEVLISRPGAGKANT